ncbi:MAG TPA: DUF1080 domain-containing protein [Gemmatimonadaceae bacterium]|nr:DUF1080 domain-containing protein [Gemmatimonadaceae bacterium]
MTFRIASPAAAGVALAALLLAGCARARSDAQPETTAAAPAAAAAPDAGAQPPTTMNTLSSEERAAGWRLLFDGQSTDAWRGYQQQTMPDGWQVQDGLLTKQEGTGDIVTKDQFGDFELAFDWKLARGGNAGVFYRATEEYDHVYWSGPEYQLLDDPNHPDGRNRLTSAGAAYGLYPAPAGVVKAADEWNSSRIVVRGNHVEHWLNGQKLLEYELGSPDWEAKVKASKFVDWPHYGRAARGHIGIQGDHDGALALRNIKIRELP